LKNKRFLKKLVADRTPIPYTESVIRAGVLEQKFGYLVSRSKPGGFHHGEEEEEGEDPEVIWPMSPPLSKTGASSMRLQTQLRLVVCQERAGLVPALLRLKASGKSRCRGVSAAAHP
jgi:hypothetical protein